MRLCILIILSALFAVAVEPSFDCKKASKLSEKLICGSDVLKKLDIELSKQYGNTPSKADIQVQRAWMKERDKCSNEACLISAYSAA
jgi:uncharacterized protein